MHCHLTLSFHLYLFLLYSMYFVAGPRPGPPAVWLRCAGTEGSAQNIVPWLPRNCNPAVGRVQAYTVYITVLLVDFLLPTALCSSSSCASIQTVVTMACVERN